MSYTFLNLHQHDRVCDQSGLCLGQPLGSSARLGHCERLTSQQICVPLIKEGVPVANRKPTYLASILVDALKERGWNTEDIHFLGVEIINESGML